MSLVHASKLMLQFIHFSLTHWGRDKMDAISQKTFSSAFSWMKMYQLRLKFHCSLFLRVQLTIFQHWLRKWLGAVQATSSDRPTSLWWLQKPCMTRNKHQGIRDRAVYSTVVYRWFLRNLQWLCNKYCENIANLLMSILLEGLFSHLAQINTSMNMLSCQHGTESGI